MTNPTTASEWPARLKARLDDTVTESFRPELNRRWDALSGDLHRLTPEASDRARDRTLIATHKMAEPYDTAGAIRLMIGLLERRIAGEDVADKIAVAAVAAAVAWEKVPEEAIAIRTKTWAVFADAALTALEEELAETGETS